MRKRRGHISIRRAVFFICVALFALILLFLGARWLEKRQQKPEAMGDYRQRYAYDTVIEVGGVSYRQRKELTTVLLMGIDRDSETEAVGFRDGGMADFQRLLVIDPVKKIISQIAIDRDTMTPITVLGILGDISSTRTMQICLAHAFGDGKEQSCRFTVDAVSNMMLGTKIDHYVAMNLDGISTLNDWVGGVTVTLDDDFSHIDPEMTAGKTITLVGDQAETFVRSRRTVGDGLNASRMGRQQQFITGLSTKLGERFHEDKQSIGDLYDQLQPYLVTDLARGGIINEAWAARDYTLTDIIEIPGTHEISSKGFMEFYYDEDALRQLVLDTFYEPMK